MLNARLKPFPLLLTATIEPPAGALFFRRSDPGVRLDDYRRALRLYVRLPDGVVDRIIFADTPAATCRRWKRSQPRPSAKEVELLSFRGRDYPVEQGRSVGETYLIDDALERSHLLSSLRDDELFWKVTGRLRVRTIVRLVASTPRCELCGSASASASASCRGCASSR